MKKLQDISIAKRTKTSKDRHCKNKKVVKKQGKKFKLQEIQVGKKE